MNREIHNAGREHADSDAIAYSFVPNVLSETRPQPQRYMADRSQTCSLVYASILSAAQELLSIQLQRRPACIEGFASPRALPPAWILRAAKGAFGNTHLGELAGWVPLGSKLENGHKIVLHSMGEVVRAAGFALGCSRGRCRDFSAPGLATMRQRIDDVGP